MRIHDLFAANGGLVTTAQLLSVITKKALASHLEAGAIVRVWHGVYALEPPDTLGRLTALEVVTGRPIVACLGTAAEFHGFDIEGDSRLHVLDPGVRIRPNRDLMVHQRLGAPLRRVSGRLMTAPAWTAVEIARTVNRRRVLATLDAALRSGGCSTAELARAVAEQKGRRGIVAVRDLLPLADGLAESPMESEARLVFHDGGLPAPVLQYEIIDRCGDLWRVDFAWPEAMVAAEYDSMEWHASPERWKRDRVKAARLGDLGWTLVPFVVDDVRRHPADLVWRVAGRLDAGRLAG
ncbi:MAG: type IV toxin-antitoxin system AbiEi family antitoxin domain-containing protein [Mycobacterium sp.]|nr:type IV toxin-antitoxin system AbiEi family antitoxin domain-containing protein [Mycobacterium sp.]